MPLGAFKAAIMGVSGVSTADVVLLSTLTADESATLEFTGLTSAYVEYIFRFYNMHPSAQGPELTVHFSIDGGSNYNVTSTTTSWNANHSGTVPSSTTTLEYVLASDQAQYDPGRYQELIPNIGYDTYDNMAGELHLFNPASTVYVKHYYARASSIGASNYSFDAYNAGYFNTTSAVDAVSFKMASGNIDVGKIKMWGVK